MVFGRQETLRLTVRAAHLLFPSLSRDINSELKRVVVVVVVIATFFSTMLKMLSGPYFMPTA